MRIICLAWYTTITIDFGDGNNMWGKFNEDFRYQVVSVGVDLPAPHDDDLPAVLVVTLKWNVDPEKVTKVVPNEVSQSSVPLFFSLNIISHPSI